MKNSVIKESLSDSNENENESTAANRNTNRCVYKKTSLDILEYKTHTN